MNEDKIAKELEAYRTLARSDKKVDIASLALNALQKHEDNSLSVKQKRWAYLISLIAPPLGLIFVVKFYLSGKDDGEQAAWVCGVLTALSILLLILFVKVILSGANTNLNQIQQIKPSDIQQFYQ